MSDQAINGIPHEAVVALDKARAVLRAIIIDKAAGVHYAAAQATCHHINHVLKLRALLDAPETRTPFEMKYDMEPGDEVAFREWRAGRRNPSGAGL